MWTQSYVKSLRLPSQGTLPKARFTAPATAAAILLLAASSVFAVDNVINQSLLDWKTAATTGRADVLVYGDSTVESNSWTKAIEIGASQKLGLAGTGLMPGAVPNGSDSGTNTNTNNYLGNFSHDYTLVRPATVWAAGDGSVPSGLTGYLPAYGWNDGPGGRSFFSATAGSTAIGGLGFRLGQAPSGAAGAAAGTYLSPAAAYDFTVWTGNTTAGSMGAQRLNSSGTVLATASNVATNSTGSLQKTSFSFAANGTSGYQDVVLSNTTNTTVFYSRLTKPGSTGATVSGWSSSGASTYGLDQHWDGTSRIGSSANHLSTAGQQAYLGALTDGGSGKLNIMIFTGLNDSHWTPVNSQTNFQTDITNLVSSIRSSWTGAGRSSSNLTFTLFGMYDASNANYSNAALRSYAQAAHDVAISDSQVSFIDIQPMDAGAGTYLQGDGVHLSQSGAEYFGPQIFNAIPEPTSLSILGGFTAWLTLRRRR